MLSVSLLEALPRASYPESRHQRYSRYRPLLWLGLLQLWLGRLSVIMRMAANTTCMKTVVTYVIVTDCAAVAVATIVTETAQ